MANNFMELFYSKFYKFKRSNVKYSDSVIERAFMFDSNSEYDRSEVVLKVCNHYAKRLESLHKLNALTDRTQHTMFNGNSGTSNHDHLSLYISQNNKHRPELSNELIDIKNIFFTMNSTKTTDFYKKKLYKSDKGLGDTEHLVSSSFEYNSNENELRKTIILLLNLRKRRYINTGKMQNHHYLVTYYTNKYDHDGVIKNVSEDFISRRNKLNSIKFRRDGYIKLAKEELQPGFFVSNKTDAELLIEWLNKLNQQTLDLLAGTSKVTTKSIEVSQSRRSIIRNLDNKTKQISTTPTTQELFPNFFTNTEISEKANTNITITDTLNQDKPKVLYKLESSQDQPKSNTRITHGSFKDYNDALSTLPFYRPYQLIVSTRQNIKSFFRCIELFSKYSFNSNGQIINYWILTSSNRTVINQPYNSYLDYTFTKSRLWWDIKINKEDEVLLSLFYYIFKDSVWVSKWPFFEQFVIAVIKIFFFIAYCLLQFRHTINEYAKYLKINILEKSNTNAIQQCKAAPTLPSNSSSNSATNLENSNGSLSFIETDAYLNNNDQLVNHVGLSNYIYVAIAITSILLLLSTLLRKRYRDNSKNIKKGTPYECGINPSAVVTTRNIEVTSIVPPLLFIVLDLEILFAIPFSISTDSTNQIFTLWLFYITFTLFGGALIVEWMSGAISSNAGFFKINEKNKTLSKVTDPSNNTGKE